MIIATEGEVTEEDNVLTERCADLISDIRCSLSTSLTQFDKEISELLMTLQLIHPANVTKITSIEDLNIFRGYVLTNPTQTLTTISIDHFLDLRKQFIDQVSCTVNKFHWKPCYVINIKFWIRQLNNPTLSLYFL